MKKGIGPEFAYNSKHVSQIFPEPHGDVSVSKFNQTEADVVYQEMLKGINTRFYNRVKNRKIWVLGSFLVKREIELGRKEVFNLFVSDRGRFLWGGGS